MIASAGGSATTKSHDKPLNAKPNNSTTHGTINTAAME
jgi:hypothetical protein